MDENKEKRRRFNWYKFALISILAGILLVSVGWLTGSRGGWLYFEGGRLRFQSDGAAETSFTPFRRGETSALSISIDTTSANVTVRTVPIGELPGVHFVNIPEDEIEVDIDLNAVTINTRQAERRGFLNFGLSNARREIRVYVPRNNGFGRLDIQSSSGTVRLEDLHIGGIEVRSSSGSIRMENLELSHISARTTSGSIRGENISTRTGDVFSTSGSINLSDVVWSDFNANTTSGSVRVDGEVVPLQDIFYETFDTFTRVGSTSGNVRLTIRGNREDFDYRASSHSGTIRIDGERQNRAVTSDFAADRHSISLQTTSGSIRLDFE